MGTQQVTVQAAQPAQQQPPQPPQQKVTYAATTQLQPGIKTQFFTTASIAQSQKATGAQQIQVCAGPAAALLLSRTRPGHSRFLCSQVAKIPQIVQQQPAAVANIQQIVSSPQQVGRPTAAPLGSLLPTPGTTCVSSSLETLGSACPKQEADRKQCV